MVVILATILFICPGQINWLTGWIFVSMYVCIIVISVIVIPLGQELVEERTGIKEGVKVWDKSITIVGSILYPLGIFVVAG